LISITFVYILARTVFGVPFEGNLGVFALGCLLFLVTYLAQGLLISVVTRQQTIAPVEVAHRACSACLVHHIAMRAGRKLYWDPLAERFNNDDRANALLSRPQRPPYVLP